MPPTTAAELLAAEGLEKTVRLVITSGLVKRQTFLDALADQLEPPCKRVRPAGGAGAGGLHAGGRSCGCARPRGSVCLWASGKAVCAVDVRPLLAGCFRGSSRRICTCNESGRRPIAFGATQRGAARRTARSASWQEEAPAASWRHLAIAPAAAARCRRRATSPRWTASSRCSRASSFAKACPWSLLPRRGGWSRASTARRCAVWGGGSACCLPAPRLRLASRLASRPACCSGVPVRGGNRLGAPGMERRAAGVRKMRHEGRGEAWGSRGDATASEGPGSAALASHACLPHSGASSGGPQQVSPPGILPCPPRQRAAP